MSRNPMPLLPNAQRNAASNVTPQPSPLHFQHSSLGLPQLRQQVRESHNHWVTYYKPTGRSPIEAFCSTLPPLLSGLKNQYGWKSLIGWIKELDMCKLDLINLNTNTNPSPQQFRGGGINMISPFESKLPQTLSAVLYAYRPTIIKLSNTIPIHHSRQIIQSYPSLPQCFINVVSDPTLLNLFLNEIVSTNTDPVIEKIDLDIQLFRLLDYLDVAIAMFLEQITTERTAQIPLYGCLSRMLYATCLLSSAITSILGSFDDPLSRSESARYLFETHFIQSPPQQLPSSFPLPDHGSSIQGQQDSKMGKLPEIQFFNQDPSRHVNLLLEAFNPLNPTTTGNSTSNNVKTTTIGQKDTSAPEVCSRTLTTTSAQVSSPTITPKTITPRTSATITTPPNSNRTVDSYTDHDDNNNFRNLVNNSHTNHSSPSPYPYQYDDYFDINDAIVNIDGSEPSYFNRYDSNYLPYHSPPLPDQNPLDLINSSQWPNIHDNHEDNFQNTLLYPYHPGLPNNVVDVIDENLFQDVTPENDQDTGNITAMINAITQPSFYTVFTVVLTLFRHLNTITMFASEYGQQLALTGFKVEQFITRINSILTPPAVVPIVSMPGHSAELIPQPSNISTNFFAPTSYGLVQYNPWVGTSDEVSGAGDEVEIVLDNPAATNVSNVFAMDTTHAPLTSPITPTTSTQIPLKEPYHVGDYIDLATNTLLQIPLPNHSTFSAFLSLINTIIGKHNWPIMLDRSTMHTTACHYSSQHGNLHTIIINGTQPKSLWDLFFLMLSRALSGMIITTGKITRSDVFSHVKLFHPVEHILKYLQKLSCLVTLIRTSPIDSFPDILGYVRHVQCQVSRTVRAYLSTSFEKDEHYYSQRQLCLTKHRIARDFLSSFEKINQSNNIVVLTRFLTEPIMKVIKNNSEQFQFGLIPGILAQTPTASRSHHHNVPNSGNNGSKFHRGSTTSSSGVLMNHRVNHHPNKKQSPHSRSPSQSGLQTQHDPQSHQPLVDSPIYSIDQLFPSQLNQFFPKGSPNTIPRPAPKYSLLLILELFIALGQEPAPISIDWLTPHLACGQPATVWVLPVVTQFLTFIIAPLLLTVFPTSFPLAGEEISAAPTPAFANYQLISNDNTQCCFGTPFTGFDGPQSESFSDPASQPFSSVMKCTSQSSSLGFGNGNGSNSGCSTRTRLLEHFSAQSLDFQTNIFSWYQLVVKSRIVFPYRDNSVHIMCPFKGLDPNSLHNHQRAVMNIDIDSLTRNVLPTNNHIDLASDSKLTTTSATHPPFANHQTDTPINDLTSDSYHDLVENQNDIHLNIPSAGSALITITSSPIHHFCQDYSRSLLDLSSIITTPYPKELLPADQEPPSSAPLHGSLMGSDNNPNMAWQLNNKQPAYNNNDDYNSSNSYGHSSGYYRMNEPQITTPSSNFDLRDTDAQTGNGTHAQIENCNIHGLGRIHKLPPLAQFNQFGPAPAMGNLPSSAASPPSVNKITSTNTSQLEQHARIITSPIYPFEHKTFRTSTLSVWEAGPLTTRALYYPEDELPVPQSVHQAPIWPLTTIEPTKISPPAVSPFNTGLPRSSSHFPIDQPLDSHHQSQTVSDFNSRSELMPDYLFLNVYVDLDEDGKPYQQVLTPSNVVQYPPYHHRWTPPGPCDDSNSEMNDWSNAVPSLDHHVLDTYYQILNEPFRPYPILPDQHDIGLHFNSLFQQNNQFDTPQSFSSHSHLSQLFPPPPQWTDQCIPTSPHHPINDLNFKVDLVQPIHPDPGDLWGPIESHYWQRLRQDDGRIELKPHSIHHETLANHYTASSQVDLQTARIDTTNPSQSSPTGQQQPSPQQCFSLQLSRSPQQEPLPFLEELPVQSVQWQRLLACLGRVSQSQHLTRFPQIESTEQTLRNISSLGFPSKWVIPWEQVKFTDLKLKRGWTLVFLRKKKPLEESYHSPKS